jgi:hypothetical protein
MEDKIRKDIRFLKAWALSSSLLCLFFVFTAAKQGSEKTKFTEIDVERINIVEKDGRLRLTISNNERSPGPVIGGVHMKSREGKRGAGFIFFNEKGNECGGLTWGSEEEGGKISANAGLMFDQYNQDQTVGITYSQTDDRRSSGLRVWERPLTPIAEIAEFVRELNDIELMKDGPEKAEVMKKLREKAAAVMGGAQRVFVGRTTKNEAVVSLADTKGRPRLLISVDESNMASLQFLDENGKVTHRIPEEPKPETKRP